MKTGVRARIIKAEVKSSIKEKIQKIEIKISKA